MRKEKDNNPKRTALDFIGSKMFNLLGFRTMIIDGEERINYGKISGIEMAPGEEKVMHDGMRFEMTESGELIQYNKL